MPDLSVYRARGDIVKRGSVFEELGGSFVFNPA